MRPTVALTMLCAGLMSACAGSKPAPGTVDAASSPPAGLLPAVSEIGPALFQLRIDPGALTATAEPLPGRTGAGFQASMYDLDLTRFQTWKQFEIVGTRLTAELDLEVVYRHSHPWPAPNPSLPPSALNRADLSYTGRAVFLADVEPVDLPAQTFFGDVIANTHVIRYADGYVRRGGVLGVTGLTANTFPYKLLSDDQVYNFTSGSTLVTETGEDTTLGNYDAGTLEPTGWQRSNLGPRHVSWEGYDSVHAGQTHEQRVRIHGDWLARGPLALQVAILLKYTEPKGSASPLLRLPPATVDVAQFAYRMPHGALDCSKILVDFGEGNNGFDDIVQIPAVAGESFMLDCDIRDWDRGAVEVPDPDISLQDDITAVEFQARGLPIVEASAPGLTTTIATLSSTSATATGRPGNLLNFVGSMTNDLGTTSGAEHAVFLRITDREAITQPPGSPHMGLDPATYLPDTALKILPITFQAFHVRLAPPAPAWQFVTVDPSQFNLGDPDIVLDDRGTGDPSDDRVCISYMGQSASLRYAQAELADYQTSAGWSSHELLDGAAVIGINSSLLIWQGRPAIVYKLANGGDAWPYISYAHMPDPIAPADWDHSAIEHPADGGGESICAIIAPSNDLLVAHVDAEERLAICVTTNLSPSEPEDWITYSIDDSFSGEPYRVSLCPLPAGGYALAYNGPLLNPNVPPSGLKVAITGVNVPEAADEWTMERVMPEGTLNAVSVEIWGRNDRLMVLARIGGDSGITPSWYFPRGSILASRDIDAPGTRWGYQLLRRDGDTPFGALIPVHALTDDLLFGVFRPVAFTSQVAQLLPFWARQTEGEDWTKWPVGPEVSLVNGASYNYQLDGIVLGDQVVLATMGDNEVLQIAWRSIDS